MSLGDKLIPRRVRRMFDQREEERRPVAVTAELRWRGARAPVILDNVSASGAMLTWDGAPSVGEAVELCLSGNVRAARVRWVRDGRVGIYFANSL